MKKEFTEKENQHYVPKFYLRYFSFHGNEKQIGLYNKRNKFFISTAKLKKQASKKYFYGRDGQVEDWLCTIEGLVSPILNKMHTKEELPPLMSTIQADLLFFIILLDLRNPTRLNQWNQGKQLIKNRLLEHNIENANSSIVKAIDSMVDSEGNIKMLISNTKGIVPYCMDLEYKLIKNISQIPFVTSDYPLIKYNQFLESRKWNFGGHNGYGTIGAQMFMPLNDSYTIMFFDPKVYKVGNRKEKVVTINNESSINQLNILQFLNCQEHLYFNHKVTRQYIDKLTIDSQRFSKANQSFLEHFKVDDGNGKIKKNEEVLFVGMSDLKINLKLQKVKYLSAVNGIKLDNSAAQFRPKANEYYNYEQKQKLRPTRANK